MSNAIFWELEDEDGDNPTTVPGSFGVRVYFEINYGDPGVWRDRNGDGYPGEAPSIDIIAGECLDVWFGEEQQRPATSEERATLGDWAAGYIEARPVLFERLEREALEQAYVGHDIDDTRDF